MSSENHRIELGCIVEDGNQGETLRIPAIEILSGRGFITGKSGSGKSNTASVIFEEFLDAGLSCLIVDTDGEYWGLREKYELLHLGGDDECQRRVGPEHADWIAETVLVDRIPVILDVSGYADEGGSDVDSDIARELLEQVATALFTKAKTHKQPTLFAVEEIHEFIPEGGKLGSLGQRLVKIGKRGRKHGLGIMGMSQRPADVKKSYITQCDWLVWHRLTWNNDTRVVSSVLGSEYADAIETFADGEAWLMTDWDGEVRRVRMREKHTFDAGARPGLDGIDRPDLKGIDDDLLDGLDEVAEEAAQRHDRISQLEHQLGEKDDQIAELEAELSQAEDMSAMAEQFTEALLSQDAGNGGDGSPQQVIEAEVMEVRQQKRELEETVEAKDDRIAGLEARVAELEEYEQRVERLEGLDLDTAEEAVHRLAESIGMDAATGSDDGAGKWRQKYRDAQDRIERLEQRLDDAEAASSDGTATVTPDAGISDLISHDAVQAAVVSAKDASQYSDGHFDRVLAILANADGGGKTASDIAPLTDVSESTVREVLKELHRSGILNQSTKDRAKSYRLDREFLERRVEVAQQQASM